jgi:hypothetical protein
MTITVNSIATTVPVPSAFEATYNTQQKSAERDNEGKLHRETLPDKWTLKLEWVFDTPAASYAWFNYLKSITRLDFSVNFPAPTGNNEVATFYISPITAKLLYYMSTSGWWRTMSCTFVEV